MTENRRSFRFQSSDAVHGELILANGRRWPICIADQSAGGFGVLTDSLPPAKSGDLAELRTESFACEVRVVHITRNEGAASGSVESQPAPTYSLGLIRLRDISIKSDNRKRNERHVRWRHVVPDAVQNPLALFAVVFGAVVVASTIVGVLSSTDSPERVGVNAHSDQGVSAGGSLHDRKSSSDPAGTARGSAAQPQRNAQLDSRSVELRRLPGALPFVMTGVVRELDLTDDQIERIHRIIDDTNAAIAQNEVMRQLLDGARSEAVGVLTVQQRRQWESLSGANRSAIVPDAAAKSTPH
jgi:hypothetical protein